MKTVLIILGFLIFIYIVMKAIAIICDEGKSADKNNPYIHPDIADSVLSEEMVYFTKNMPKAPNRKSGIYEKVFKKTLDLIVSFLGLLILSPLFLILIIAIKIDDPGPAMFVQIRVGKDKKFFRLHKFRSMKMSTPHDTPTHMLESPQKYITGVGKLLRKMSLDEIPQIWDIFRGKMSIIGPRPALWNQADLVYEREEHGVNGLTPGLTGLAQINGRDELIIQQKVEYDARYLERISFSFDVKCFFSTVGSVLKHKGVVEGGTGELQKQYNKAKK